MGQKEKVYLGNLDARRDWGYAPEYVEAMWLILQQDKPDDYVIATGETHSVREFATAAFQAAGFELRWQGEGVQEKGIDKDSGSVLVEIDPKYYRPTEVDLLIGDASKAKRELGWQSSTTFDQLVEKMVKHDLEQQLPG